MMCSTVHHWGKRDLYTRVYIRMCIYTVKYGIYFGV